MSLGNRLRDARKCAGYTQKQLAERIGAKHNSVSNWENGLNMPDPATIEAICASLGVTPNDLLMGEELGAALALHGGFSASESALLKKYRGLDMSARGAVDALMDYYYGLATAKAASFPARSRHMPALAEVHKTGTPAFEVVNGRISIQSVAAGTGTYLDDDSFENILVMKNDMTKRASFYVPVSGDSMEPRFHDGDILIIEQTPVKYGEIGIFTLDGNGFVKMRGKSELISLNPDYEPIPMNDDIICNGKVIGILEPEWLMV